MAGEIQRALIRSSRWYRGLTLREKVGFTALVLIVRGAISGFTDGFRWYRGLPLWKKVGIPVLLLFVGWWNGEVMEYDEEAALAYRRENRTETAR
jgi:hypothetical protein